MAKSIRYSITEDQLKLIKEIVADALLLADRTKRREVEDLLFELTYLRGKKECACS